MEFFEGVINRFKQALQAETVEKLAQALGLFEEEVRASVKKQEIPAVWYVLAYKTKGVDPEWLQYGKGTMLAPEVRFLQIPEEEWEKAAMFAELIHPLPAHLQDCALATVRYMVEAYRQGETRKNAERCPLN